MRRDAVTAVSVRLAASGALCVLMAEPALAGDRALIDFIGYSEDGRYFASWETGDGTQAGCAEYAATPVGALAKVIAA